MPKQIYYKRIKKTSLSIVRRKIENLTEFEPRIFFFAGMCIISTPQKRIETLILNLNKPRNQMIHVILLNRLLLW